MNEFYREQENFISVVKIAKSLFPSRGSGLNGKEGSKLERATRSDSG